MNCNPTNNERIKILINFVMSNNGYSMEEMNAEFRFQTIEGTDLISSFCTCTISGSVVIYKVSKVGLEYSIEPVSEIYNY